MSIIEYLNSQKIDSETAYPETKMGIDYLNKFFESFNDNNFINGQNFKDICTVYFTCITPEKHQDIRAMIQKYEKLFTPSNIEVLTILFILAGDTDFRALCKSDTFQKASLDTALETLALKYNISKAGALKFLFRFMFHINDFKEFINFFSSISFSKEHAKELIFILDTICYGKASNKNNIMTANSFLSFRYYNCKKAYGKTIREVYRFNNTIQKIIDTLLRHPSYITPEVMDEILSYNVKDEIKHAILDYIYTVNSQTEASIIESYEVSKTSSKDTLKDLLSAYNIDIDSLSSEDIANLSNMSSLKLRQILDFFFNFNIPIKNISRIAFYDLEIINTIAGLIQSGTLTTSFVADNIDMLEKDSSKYKQVVNNLRLLSNMDINIRNYPESLAILLKSLTTNIWILSKYGVTITSKTKDISFLGDSDLTEKLDLLIESGKDLSKLPSYDILNNSFEDLYIMMLSSSLEIEHNKELYSSFAIKDLMPHTDWLIPTEYLILFEFNDGSINIPDFLEEYAINPYTLCVNGVYLSLNRVLRNIACINPDDIQGVFYAFIYKSYFNLNQVDLLKEELEKIKGRR